MNAKNGTFAARGTVLILSARVKCDTSKNPLGPALSSGHSSFDPNRKNFPKHHLLSYRDAVTHCELFPHSSFNSHYGHRARVAEGVERDSFSARAPGASRQSSRDSGSKEVVAMKLALGALAIVLLAVPVAIFLIINLPGLGVLLAIVLFAAPFFVHDQRVRAAREAKQMQENRNAHGYAAHTHAA